MIVNTITIVEFIILRKCDTYLTYYNYNLLYVCLHVSIAVSKTNKE